MALKVFEVFAKKSPALNYSKLLSHGQIVKNTSPRQTRCYRTSRYPQSNQKFRVWRSNPYIRVSEEVTAALDVRQPVVALETAIYTHGKPFRSVFNIRTELREV